ncbi:hypothetical protein [Polyangium spumosum]|uniref:SH3 domain-containing protein n=1 Tax=Polyangium spumosum TaxID=889282 RepID=A0A6N7PPF4_9BACT|nr:hypothetical protein [Polyangium spumosum]MRG92024.1 hypothetical protein [Polyangium spumosum]
MTISSVPPPPEAPAPERHGPSPRPGRWTDTLTTLLLVATACLVALSATPALLRAAGVAPFGPSDGFRSPLRDLTEPHSLGGHPAEGDEEEDDRGNDPLLTPRFDVFEDRPRGAARGGVNTAEPGDDAPRARMRPAVVRRKATLRLSASEDADPIGELKPGDSLFVVRESGEWALVMQTGAEGVLMGWTQKSQLAIR